MNDTAKLPSTYLATTDLFCLVDPALLRRLDNQTNWVQLRGGEILFARGDPADAAYVVASGSMEVSVDEDNGGLRPLSQLGRGAWFGEMGLLLEEPRTATVRAARDSELVRIPKEDFDAIVASAPHIALDLARLIAKRLARMTESPRAVRSTRTVAVFPVGPAGLPVDFGERFARTLGNGTGAVVYLTQSTVDAQLGPGLAQVSTEHADNGRLLAWLNALEEKCRFVVYECDALGLRREREAPGRGWTERCLRQADLVLFVADSGAPPDAHVLTTALAITEQAGSRAPRELVLLHAQSRRLPEGTGNWLRLAPFTTHHHVRLHDDGDFARLARFIRGATGAVVLSGGGARGFAHIGVLRALAENNVLIDSIGGASMGALIAGQFAMGWDVSAMIEANREAFGGLGGINDFTIPMVSLIKGGRFVKLLRGLFGDVQIEDLWTGYFCVSCNLSRADMVVHDRGPLWLWARASCSLPGIEPPVTYGGDLLVDGAVLNNLPADVMRSRCAGEVIAVDVGSPVDLRTDELVRSQISGTVEMWRKLNPLGKRSAMPNIFQILRRAGMVSSLYNLKGVKQHADLYLCPPTQGLNAFDWKSIDKAVEIGYRYALPIVEQWNRR
jgi:predicted acylesterase/phospholipase RssA/CRP-like cAMP-binding protein